MNAEVNYLHIKKFSLRYRYFMYLDHVSNTADSLFIQNEVQVDFLREYEKERL